MFKVLSTEQQDARFRESLKVVPVHNTSARIVPSENPDELELHVTLLYSGALMTTIQRVLKLRSSKTYILDGIGKMVYESVDGRKTFEQLIDEFSASQKLTFFESRALLGKYFQDLTKRGVIVATLPQQAH